MSRNTRYVCVCNNSYSTKRQVLIHISVCKYAQSHLLQNERSKCESYVNDSENSRNSQSQFEEIEEIEQFQCGCKKSFLSKSGYYRHIRKCHLRPEPHTITGKIKCSEPGCAMTFKYIRDFRHHLNEKHQIQFDVEDKKFNTYSDFLIWKVIYEAETSTSYYHRKYSKPNGRRVEYWFCNHSGCYLRPGERRRQKLKSQGLLKINNNCTSSITLYIDANDANVYATIHHTHYGHNAELVHLPIPKTDKPDIASKLSSHKEDELSKQTKRKYLIEQRDILKVTKKYDMNVMLPKVVLLKNKSKCIIREIVEIPAIDLLPNTTEANKRHFTTSQLALSSVSPIHENITPVTDSLPNTTEANKRHFTASQLALSSVSPIHENSWRISEGNLLVSTLSSNNCNQGVYNVTKNGIIPCSSDKCKSYCNYCNICYHAYSCTCSDFISKTVICEHIHLTVFYQANPETNQNEDHVERCLFGNEDHTMYTLNYREPPNSPQPIKEVKLCQQNNDINKPINMEEINLEKIKRRLKKLMMDTIQEIDECCNNDLLENLEKQITIISCSLSRDSS